MAGKALRHCDHAGRRAAEYELNVDSVCRGLHWSPTPNSDVDSNIESLTMRNWSSLEPDTEFGR